MSKLKSSKSVVITWEKLRKKYLKKDLCHVEEKL